ncbi:MAG: methyltransferase domain-containing protein [Myxococcota bacterium]
MNAPRLLMLRKLFERGTAVASVTESSRALAEATCRALDPARPQVVVELGCGAGAITRVAASRLHPEGRLVALEIDPELARLARDRVPRADVRVADVADLGGVLADVDDVDVVLSGLPLPSLPVATVRAVLDWLRTHPGATFHQLTVMPWVYRARYQSLFEQVEFELVPWNLPPAGVYHCRTVRVPHDGAEPSHSDAVG